MVDRGKHDDDLQSAFVYIHLKAATCWSGKSSIEATLVTPRRRGLRLCELTHLIAGSLSERKYVHPPSEPLCRGNRTSRSKGVLPSEWKITDRTEREQREAVA